MGRSSGQLVGGMCKIFTGKRALPFGRSTVSSPNAFEGCSDYVAGSVLTNTWEKRFELIADTRQIGGDRCGVDEVALERDVETEGVWSGIDREVVHFAESEVRI